MNFRSVSVLVPLVLLGSGVLTGEEAPRPNFIVINVDDLGYADIGPFGSDNKTPNLDRMAAEGRKLTSHYAAPVCSPSRASLMTGCYPKRVLPIEHVLFPGAEVGLHGDEVTLAELLRSGGYATACVGKWHLGDQLEFLPRRQGFDFYFGIPYSNDMGTIADGSKNNPGSLPGKPKAVAKPQPRDECGIRGNAQPPLPLIENETVVARVKAEEQTSMTRVLTEKAVAFLTENREKPFFLYLPHVAVHFPLYPGLDYRGKSPNGLIGDWAEEVDWSVGRILDTLRESGVDKRTLVIFTSDNGGALNHGSNNQPLRGSKGSTLEGGIRVCTIAWWPGKISAGTETSALTSHMDIFPTFASLAGVPVPGERVLDGVDLWPVLTGDGEGRDSFHYFRGSKLEAVRQGPWKLHLAKGELYHLDDDIGEGKNVASENPDEVALLRELAATMDADLGNSGFGSGCRAIGRVADPRSILDHDGKVREDMAGEIKRFP